MDPFLARVGSSGEARDERYSKVCLKTTKVEGQSKPRIRVADKISSTTQRTRCRGPSYLLTGRNHIITRCHLPRKGKEEEEEEEGEERAKSVSQSV